MLADLSFLAVWLVREGGVQSLQARGKRKCRQVW